MEHITTRPGRGQQAARETGFRVFLDPVGHPFCIVFGQPNT